MNVFDALLGDTEAGISILVHSATNSLLVVAEMELRKYRVVVGYADHCALRAIVRQIVTARTIGAIKSNVIGDRDDQSQYMGACPPAVVSAEPCTPTRAQSLIASGLVDAAIQITDLANSLTSSVMQAVQTAISEKGNKAFGDDIDCLRSAVFSAIAEVIIRRIEQRLWAEPLTRDVLSIPPDPNKLAKLAEAKRSHAARRRRNGQ